MSLQIGQHAPDFTLDAVVGKEFKKVSLKDYKGKWVVLFFYPLDFTFICPTEILEFSKRAGEFGKLGAQILGGSIDSKFSHLAWVNKDLGELGFPLFADITKQVSRAYDVLDEDAGIAFRATIIIDPEGKVQYILKHTTGIGRSVDETVRSLQALQSGELCPVGWKPGEKTLGKR
jgi:alkyl hydroperoxide reductase subunit AhpC